MINAQRYIHIYIYIYLHICIYAICRAKISKDQQRVSWSQSCVCKWLGHSAKNTGGQLCSMLRTIQYGFLWTDVTACRTLGMPPSVLARTNPMSDRMHCLLMNPYFYVRSVEACQHVVPDPPQKRSRMFKDVHDGSIMFQLQNEKKQRQIWVRQCMSLYVMVNRCK